MTWDCPTTPHNSYSFSCTYSILFKISFYGFVTASNYLANFFQKLSGLALNKERLSRGGGQGEHPPPPKKLSNMYC